MILPSFFPGCHRKSGFAASACTLCASLACFSTKNNEKMQFNVTSRTLIVNYLCMFLLNSDI